jgi:hypothetical protein
MPHALSSRHLIRRLRAMLTARAAILAALVVRGAAGQRPAPSTCRPDVGRVPRVLTMRDGRPVYVEAPIPVRFSRGFVLLGTPTFVWQSPTVFADVAPAGRAAIAVQAPAGVVVTPGPGADPVPMPPGVTHFLSPRAVTGGRGTLDVFWGESPDTSYRAQEHTPELWHARYAAAGWRPPERVLAFQEIWWNHTFPALQGTARAPIVAVPVRQSGARGDTVGILVLRRARGSWRRAWIPAGPLPPTFVVLSPVGPREIVLAFIGSRAPAPGRVEANGVFVTRSRDGGATWTSPQLIRAFGFAGVNWLQLVTTRDGALHLYWTVDRADGAPAPVRTIERAFSRDRGATWQSGPSISNDSSVEALVAAPLGDGMVLVGRRRGDRRLVAGSITDTGAVTLTLLPFEPAATLPRLGALGPDSLLLNWGARRANAYPRFPALRAPVLLTTLITTRCDSMP